MEWTGSIHWIHNPVQSRRTWIGLDQKLTNSADSGLDWIQKCAMCIPYLDLRQFLLIVTLTSEVLPSNIQLFTSSFVFTCRLFYKAFGRYLLCCARIGLDWIKILVHQLDWTGLGSVTRGFGLEWIVSTRSIPYSGHKAPGRPVQEAPACLDRGRWMAPTEGAGTGRGIAFPLPLLLAG